MEKINATHEKTKSEAGKQKRPPVQEYQPEMYSGETSKVLKLQRDVGNRNVQKLFGLGNKATPIQRQPMGTVETSEGVEEIEGDVINAPSGESIRERLAAQAGNINVNIQSWVEDGVGDLHDGIQDAANSFLNWYQGRPRKPNNAQFVTNLATAVVGVIGAAFPPAGIAAAVIGGLLTVAGGPISEALDPNAEPDDQARRLQQNMIRTGVQLELKFANFGPRLQRDAPEVWNSIGTASTMTPPLLDIAQEELYSKGGIPKPNQPYAEQLLSKMIYEYNDWEAMAKVRGSTFFISPESVEYALFTEDVRERMRREAAAESRRRLGAP